MIADAEDLEPDFDAALPELTDNQKKQARKMPDYEAAAWLCLMMCPVLDEKFIEMQAAEKEMEVVGYTRGIKRLKKAVRTAADAAMEAYEQDPLNW